MEDKKIARQRVYKVIMLVVLTAVITFMTTTIFLYREYGDYIALGKSANGSSSTDTEAESTISATLKMFKNLIKSKYIYDVDNIKLVDGALKGYIDALGDPYTTYLTKEEMEEFTEEASSEYVGIGIYVSNVDDQILIVGVMKDSPALEAGIQAGDIITKVNGVEYSGAQLSEATSVLKGKEETNADVTILRNDEEKTVTVTRKKITVEHVASQMIDNDIAYIEISSFDSGVADSFERQLKELLNKGAKKIIIDVRSNGGGIVDEATQIADLFIDKGKSILITKGKNDSEKVTTAENDPIVKNIPVAILTNESTASASEILAGALKDQYGATLVGKTTYGKGVIQTLYSLQDGSGIKITTDEYYTPNHNQINKKGLTPDYEVDLTVGEDGYYETSIDKDAQLLKAREILNK